MPPVLPVVLGHKAQPAGTCGPVSGGRVYRGAVLRMGQRVRLRQAWHEQ